MISMNVLTTIPLKVLRLRSFKHILRVTALLFWTAVLVLPAFAQKNTDFVVVLDTSVGMFDSFEESTELLIEEVLKKQLTPQDSFHLISFNGSPEFEIERVLSNETPIKEVLSRLMLLQPLGQHCDIVAAVKYATEYVDELPLNSRKRILLITQGSHVPPPESPYLDKEENSDRIDNLASFIRRNGWEMDIVRFPGGGEDDEADSAEEKVLLGRLAENLRIPVVQPEEEDETFVLKATGAVEVSFPEETIKGGREFSLPLVFTNHSHEKKNIVIDSIVAEGDGITEESGLLGDPYSFFLEEEEEIEVDIPLNLPESYPEGNHELTLSLDVRRGGPIDPESGTVRVEIKEGGASMFKGEGGTYLLYVLIFIILVIPLFLLVRRIFPSGDEDEKSKGRAAAAGTGELMSAGRKSATTAGTGEAAAAGTRSYSGREPGSKADKRPERGSDKSTFDREYGTDLDKKQDNKKQDKERENLFSQSRDKQETSTTLVSTSRDESKDRASALSAFKKSSFTEESKERAAGLGSFKRSGAGSGAKSRASAAGFSGIVYRKRKEAGEKPIELRIDFQHPTPDKNLSWFRKGEERTLGGPGSGADYIITTIPVEGIVASIRRNGDIFEFKPLKDDYFPDYRGKEGENILDKRVKIRSPETERITNFSLREWVPTTERLNRYLHIIDRAGKPEGETDLDL